MKRFDIDPASMHYRCHIFPVENSFSIFLSSILWLSFSHSRYIFDIISDSYRRWGIRYELSLICSRFIVHPASLIQLPRWLLDHVASSLLSFFRGWIHFLLNARSILRHQVFDYLSKGLSVFNTFPQSGLLIVEVPWRNLKEKGREWSPWIFGLWRR